MLSPPLLKECRSLAGFWHYVLYARPHIPPLRVHISRPVLLLKEQALSTVIAGQKAGVVHIFVLPRPQIPNSLSARPTPATPLLPQNLTRSGRSHTNPEDATLRSILQEGSSCSGLARFPQCAPRHHHARHPPRRGREKPEPTNAVRRQRELISIISMPYMVLAVTWRRPLVSVAHIISASSSEASLVASCTHK